MPSNMAAHTNHSNFVVKSKYHKISPLRSFLTFALRILTAHNSLARARASTHLKHGGFVFVAFSLNQT